MDLPCRRRSDAVFGNNGAMAMRTECKHYESRTYPSGDTVRKCRLDLAPEAPWRCPDDCPKFAVRRVDAGWDYGSLRGSMAPSHDEPMDLGGDVAAVLNDAEDIVNAAGREIVSEQAQVEERRARKKRFRRRRR